MDKLTIGHPRWQEFIGRLEQRLEFREAGDQPGKYQWRCGKGEDRFAYAREVLTEMGLQPAASLTADLLNPGRSPGSAAIGFQGPGRSLHKLRCRSA